MATTTPVPATTGEPAMRLRGLRKVYAATAVPALDGVDLDLAAGTFTAIMGPSGSGKSTLLHCAAGLDVPDAGEVLLGGTDLAALDETRRTLLRRDRLGFVFQAYNLVGSLTVATNVALPLVLAGQRPRPATVEAALASVGLTGTGRRRPAELSGGQQQRVAIARALVASPAVLFADEPTGALDTGSGREVLAMLRALVDDAGRTVVMVTHDPIAAAHADRVVFLRDGRMAGELAEPSTDAVAAHMVELEPSS